MKYQKCCIDHLLPEIFTKMITYIIFFIGRIIWISEKNI